MRARSLLGSDTAPGAHDAARVPRAEWNLNNLVEFDVTQGFRPDWSVAVRISGAVVGYIRPHPDSYPASGSYHYFRRLTNVVEPLYEDRDLMTLLQRVARHP